MIPFARKLTTAFALALLLVAAPAFAADVDGKWTGTISTPGGGTAKVRSWKPSRSASSSRTGIGSRPAGLS